MLHVIITSNEIVGNMYKVNHGLRCTFIEVQEHQTVWFRYCRDIVERLDTSGSHEVTLAALLKLASRRVCSKCLLQATSGLKLIILVNNYTRKSLAPRVTIYQTTSHEMSA